MTSSDTNNYAHRAIITSYPSPFRRSHLLISTPLSSNSPQQPLNPPLRAPNPPLQIPPPLVTRPPYHSPLNPPVRPQHYPSSSAVRPPNLNLPAAGVECFDVTDHFPSIIISPSPSAPIAEPSFLPQRLDGSEPLVVRDELAAQGAHEAGKALGAGGFAGFGVRCGWRAVRFGWWEVFGDERLQRDAGRDRVFVDVEGGGRGGGPVQEEVVWLKEGACGREWVNWAVR